VARCLIIACGCRGLALAHALRERDHAVRGTTRRPAHLVEIEQAGVEAVLADPDRVSTVVPAFEHVSVACLLLGSATGPVEQVEALHGTRLEMMLTKMLDTTIRGVVYESAGRVPEATLAAGAARIRGACEGSRIPHALIEAEPEPHDGWLAAAVAAVERVL
jgi:nucleoside-diphosphate-sugar epimerase